MRNLNKKVHFMGIGGSGMSGVALIAAGEGFAVSGCDLEEETAYSGKLKNAEIKVAQGHSVSHLQDIDILAVTPATFYQNKDHPELVAGKKRGVLLTWQEFLGKYLEKGKEVICIAGTHGKSTTTALASLLFENAGLDPSVSVGATVKQWNANFRVGKSKFFINEADEFFDNFLNYSPDIIILNNIEFDHPDYFENEEEVLESFKKFILRLKGARTLIFNQDAQGIKKLFAVIPKTVFSSINLVGYTLKDRLLTECRDSFKAEEISLNPQFSSFRVVNKKRQFKGDFKIKIPGNYNIANSLGVVALGVVNNIEVEVIQRTLAGFEGVGRRMELVGQPRGVFVYDDYAHHPTAIRETLLGLRQKYPNSKIWAIVEPHTFSRTKALLPLYRNSFKSADEIIIAPIFQSRDKENFGVSGKSIVEVSGHKSIRYLNHFDDILKFLQGNVTKGDVVIVMGAGLSYKLTRLIVQSL